MKFINCISCIVLSFFSMTILAMQNIQTDFSKPGSDVVILKSSDDIGFIVDVDLAKSSNTIKNLIGDVGLEDPIELPQVAARDLEQLLILFNEGPLKEGLTLLDLANLVEAANYLDNEMVKGNLIKEIGRKLIWDQAAFERIFNARFPHEDKTKIIKDFAEIVGENWTLERLTALLNYTINDGYKVALITKLIKQNRNLLITIVPDWNVHAKRVKERGLSLMTAGYYEERPTEASKQLRDQIEALVGHYYPAIERALKEEYPDPHFSL